MQKYMKYRSVIILVNAELAMYDQHTVVKGSLAAGSGWDGL